MHTTCRQCLSTWSGHRAEHCTQCHRTFSGTTAGDAHLIGKHGVRTGPERRRCRTAEELAELGIAPDERGIWRLPAGDNPWAKQEDSLSEDAI